MSGGTSPGAAGWRTTTSARSAGSSSPKKSAELEHHTFICSNLAEARKRVRGRAYTSAISLGAAMD